MKSRRSASRCAVGLLAAVAACAGGEERRAPRASGGSEPFELVDASGRRIELPGPARRVVSLVPSASEMIHAFGRSDVLVGRTDYDTASWAAAIPSVGGGLEPSLEAVVALDPDLVIRFSGEQDTRTPARLDQLGVPHLAVRPDGVEDIYRTIGLVGRSIGEAGRADSLEAAIRAGLAQASASVRALPRVRFAYVLDGTPPWVAGSGTYIDEVLSLMGGDNAFADLSALYAPVSPEQFRQRSIDVVLLAGVQAFDASLTPGARLERLGGTLDLPGPSVVQAAHRVGEILHGRELP
jgi:iron complex transport system substrate-binding protein